MRVSDEQLEHIINWRQTFSEYETKDAMITIASELLQRRKADRWIPVSVPAEKGKSYLVSYLYSLDSLHEPNIPWVSHGCIEYNSGEWIVDSQYPLAKFIVTHYQPIPEPPEVRNDNSPPHRKASRCQLYAGSHRSVFCIRYHVSDILDVACPVLRDGG